MANLITRFLNWLEESINLVNNETDKDFLAPYNKEDIIQMGRDAEEVLKNQAFMIAVESYRDKLIQSWRKSKPIQTQERESVYHRSEALEAVVLTLRGMINNMIAEKKRIEEEKKLKGERNG